MTRRILISLIILTGAGLAQTASPTKPAPSATINVSELDRVKVENLSLKISALEKEISDFVTQFERTYPGWTVNVKTQQVFQKPEPAQPTSKK